MVEIGIDVDAERALRRLGAGSRIVDEAILEWLPIVGEHFVGLEREIGASLFKNPKGVLGGSIRAVITSHDEVEIGPNVPYAVWVNDGRGEVLAAPGKFLHFVIGGRDIFTKRVRAFPGYRFAERTAQQGTQAARDGLAAIIARRLSA